MQSRPKSDQPNEPFEPFEPESRWGGPATIFALVLAGAAALRLVGVRYGLPFGGLLNPDEQNVVPRAWDVAHGDFDPSPFFDHPSLVFYVLAPSQLGQPEPSYFAARLVAVAIGVGGVAAAWWLGARSYGVVAGGVAAVATAVATVHVAYSRMAVTDVLLTTLVTVALALVVSGRIELAAAAVGLAFAAKWPGIIAFVPIVVLEWGRWRRVAVAAAVALAVFVAASPFVVLHLGEAVSDWWTVASHARDGWLGFEHDSFAPVAFARELWDASGPTLIVGIVGLVVALALREHADRALAAFAIAYFATLLPLGSHFDRYVLPLVPVVGVLAGRFRQFAPVTLLLLIVPFTWAVRESEDLTKPDTRALAAARYTPRAMAGSTALDPSLPRPRVALGPELLELPLPVPWDRGDPLRRLSTLIARRVDYVVLTGAVEDRVLAARDEYPDEARFYEDVVRHGELIAEFAPGAHVSGPWVKIFQLPSSP